MDTSAKTFRGCELCPLGVPGGCARGRLSTASLRAEPGRQSQGSSSGFRATGRVGLRALGEGRVPRSGAAQPITAQPSAGRLGSDPAPSPRSPGRPARPRRPAAPRLRLSLFPGPPTAPGADPPLGRFEAQILTVPRPPRRAPDLPGAPPSTPRASDLPPARPGLLPPVVAHGRSAVAGSADPEG